MSLKKLESAVKKSLEESNGHCGGAEGVMQLFKKHIKESLPSTSANIGSPKLPTLNYVENMVGRFSPYAENGVPAGSYGVVECAYNIIARQLSGDPAVQPVP